MDSMDRRADLRGTSVVKALRVLTGVRSFPFPSRPGREKVKVEGRAAVWDDEVWSPAPRFLQQRFRPGRVFSFQRRLGRLAVVDVIVAAGGVGAFDDRL
jgi:hypothetical protein